MKIVTGALGLLVICGAAHAAIVRGWQGVDGLSFPPGVVIEGDIEKGDYDTLLTILRDGRARIEAVYLFTPGGDLGEAMKIGQAIRKLELSTYAPYAAATGPICSDNTRLEPAPQDPANCTCASAGFLIFLGGVHRTGEYLVVHRPRFAGGAVGSLSANDAAKAIEALNGRTESYLREMGVPSHVLEDILSIPSDSQRLLSREVVNLYFQGYIPARHEWLQSKCTNGSFATSSSEKRACESSAMTALRTESYEGFFHRKASELTDNNFSAWLFGSTLIGVPYASIHAPFPFTEDDAKRTKAPHFAHFTVPPGFPEISFADFDDPREERVVLNVNVVVREPDDRFKTSLLGRLREALGAHWMRRDMRNDAAEQEGRVGTHPVWKVTDRVEAELQEGSDVRGRYVMLSFGPFHERSVFLKDPRPDTSEEQTRALAHDVAAWPRASEFLGVSFDSLVASRPAEFRAFGVAPVLFTPSDATSNEPGYRLLGEGDDRTVHDVRVYADPGSNTLFKRVLEALEKAWGPSAIGRRNVERDYDQPDERIRHWINPTSGFEAWLVDNRSAGSGKWGVLLDIVPLVHQP